MKHMNTVVMAVAVVKDGDSILLRKMDPAKAPMPSCGRCLVDELGTKAILLNH